ncbi:HD family phosphohydrolase [Inediibacterium massiliense]|uniref:HD family phosphohydrolase n=1 Tax=Inediibacterium massiliense TaxID=1658111 RepID=UPI0006B572DA|nr:HDIG domain-containing metalloprotein [Inediibacterium massiliense]
MHFFKHIIKDVNKNVMIKFFKKRSVNYIMLMIIPFIVLFFSTVATLAPQKYELEVGQKAPEDLRAPRDIEDKKETDRLIQKAVQAVEPREKIDPTIQIDSKKKAERFFKGIDQIRQMEDISEEEKLILAKDKNVLKLSEKDLLLLLTIAEKDLKNIESYAYEMIMQVMSTGIKEEEIDKEKKNIENYFNGINEFNPSMRMLGSKIVNHSIEPNRFLDEETTQQKIKEAEESIEKVIIKKGSIIVNEGESITKEQLQILTNVGMTKQEGQDLSLYLGTALLIIMVQSLLIAYLYVFNKEICDSLPKLYLIEIIFLSVYLVSKTTYQISSYVAPVATAAMLISILLDAKLAMAVNLGMSVLLTLNNGNHMGFFITTLIGGTIGAFSGAHTHQRSNIFLSGLLVSISNVVGMMGISLINHYEWYKILVDSFYGLLNGIFCAILTIGTLPFWESAFHILTPLKLLELSNPNQPVLKKLLLEAPGTYHHSIIVGNLSEAAADAIGGDELLARVSAYYHDIGKLKRPYLFKENQLTCENPHDKIGPRLSSKIITSHVKDGIEMAKQAKLPQEIIEVIEQHHGDTLVKFFYHKAKIEEKNDQLNDDDFRYKGRKPQSKEAAIVMMADSVEAAVRSMPEPTPEKMKNLIKKIIKDKLEDEQLSECPITLKDLEKIATSFQTVLSGIFHERIEYPEMDTKKIEVAK